MNATESGACAPPPGWTGPPPPGVYGRTADLLWKVVPPIIIVFGTFGNILTVTVLLRNRRRLSSTALFLLALAISDTILLFNPPLRRWVLAMWQEDVRHTGELGCKVSIYLTYTSIQFSSWILVAVTVERLISVVWPHRVRLGCTPRNSVKIITVLFVVIFLSNIHIFYGYGRSNLPVYFNQGFCMPLYEGYRIFWNKTYAWIDFAIAFAVPFGILVVANSVIIYKLCKTRIQRHQSSLSRDKSTSNDTKTVTVMLILLSVAFFVCLSPVSVYFIYAPIWRERILEWLCVDIDVLFRLMELHELVYAITNLLGYINASLNFVLYIISGSKYRTEIKALLLCRPIGSEGVFGKSTTSSRRRTMISTVASISRNDTKSTGMKRLNDIRMNDTHLEEEQECGKSGDSL